MLIDQDGTNLHSYIAQLHIRPPTKRLAKYGSSGRYQPALRSSAALHYCWQSRSRRHTLLTLENIRVNILLFLTKAVLGSTAVSHNYILTEKRCMHVHMHARMLHTAQPHCYIPHGRTHVTHRTVALLHTARPHARYTPHGHIATPHTAATDTHYTTHGCRTCG